MKKKHLRAMALAMAALMSLTACGGGSSTSSEAGSTTAKAADTTAADTTAAAVADPNATYKETLHIAVSQQAPSLDLHKNSSLIARQMMDGTCWENSWDYLAVINFGHYIANYAWNDHVKGLNNFSGLYFWNAGYVE